MKVREVMIEDVVTVSPQTPVKEIARILYKVEVIDEARSSVAAGGGAWLAVHILSNDRTPRGKR